jgi:formylglycine-generating enzyme required for sulfatase activity
VNIESLVTANADGSFDFSRYIEESIQMFTGRNLIFDKIRNWLAAGPDAPRFFFILGEPGTGKTAIAAKLVKDGMISGHHFCIRDLAGTLIPLAFVRGIYAQLAKMYGYTAAVENLTGATISSTITANNISGTATGVSIEKIFISGAANAFQQLVADPLRALVAATAQPRHDKLTVLLIDSVDELILADDPAMRAILRGAENCPGNVRFLYTAQRDSPFCDGFAKTFARNNLNGNEQYIDLGDYVKKLVAVWTSVKPRLAEAGIALEDVISESAGSFRYIRKLFAGIQRSTLQLSASGGLPFGVSGIYAAISRSFDESEMQLVREDAACLKTTAVLAAAREPLSLRQISDFTAIPTDLIQSTIARLEQFSFGEERISPEHDRANQAGRRYSESLIPDKPTPDLQKPHEERLRDEKPQTLLLAIGYTFADREAMHALFDRILGAERAENAIREAHAAIAKKYLPPHGENERCKEEDFFDDVWQPYSSLKFETSRKWEAYMRVKYALGRDADFKTELEALRQAHSYILRNLAFHLYHADKRDELLQLFMTLAWMRKKLEVLGFDALMADLGLLSERDEIRVVKHALKLSENSLRLQPELLASHLAIRLSYQAGKMPLLKGLIDNKKLIEKPAWASDFGADEYGIYAEFSVKGVVQRMRWIPPGKFMMGSPESEAEGETNETQHEVILTQGFWLADTACTQELWEAVMGENPSSFKDDPHNPVEQVSWEMIRSEDGFLERLNAAVPGLYSCLPTESQWEYAARAGNATSFWWKHPLTTDQANYNGQYSMVDKVDGGYRRKTVPAKYFKRNAWGLWQMHGNVWEWCEDWIGDYPKGTVIDPVGPPTGASRVLRGGGWGDIGRYLRSAYRDFDQPSCAWYLNGFRLARGREEQKQG